MPTWTAKSDGQGYVLLKEGYYPVNITYAEDKTSQSGNEMIVLTCNVEGRDIKFYLVFTVKTYESIERNLTALGWKIVEGQGISVEPRDLIGRKAWAYVVLEAGSDGRDYPKIAYFVKRENCPYEGAKQATGYAPTTQARASAPAQAKPSAPSYPSRPLEDEDDIPF